MPKPYSYDISQKVIQAIKLDGLKKSEVSILFNISRNTIDLWRFATLRYRRLPSIAQSASWQWTRISLTLKNFVSSLSSHGDKTQVEMAELWSGHSLRCLRRASLTHDLTRLEENWLHAKKKTYGYRERDEDKRQAFIMQLSTYQSEKIVYLDESGMDSRDAYDYGWT